VTDAFPRLFIFPAYSLGEVIMIRKIAKRQQQEEGVRTQGLDHSHGPGLSFQRLAAWLLGQVMGKEFADVGPREAIQKHSNKIRAYQWVLHISTSRSQLKSCCPIVNPVEWLYDLSGSL